MTARWDRVTALFGAARLLQGEQREAFLAIACEGDGTIRADVEALLSSDAADDSFLATPRWHHAASPTTPLVSGQLLKDRYRIDEPLASGGQAMVYRATDQLLARPVVIKVMRVEGRHNRWLTSRFTREMEALARIDHPGVVGILDVGELEDSSPFLVIQYIPGMSLRTALAAGPLPKARVARLLPQVASALHAAHSMGIAHRDLKPENVMLQSQSDGETMVRLIDFGIAKIDRDDTAPSTTTLMIAGTVRYMAPEQFEGQHSSASDLYSLALMVCEMLTGHPDPRRLTRAVPRQVVAALEAALDYRPEARPTDVMRWSEKIAEHLAATPRRAVRAGIAVAVALALVGVVAMAPRWVQGESGAFERIVEKVGGFDPLTEGFQSRHDVTGRIVVNDAHTGYDGWRIITRGQGYYFRPFTLAQKRAAMRRGWRLSATFKVEAGGGSTGTDFAGVGERFSISVVRDGDREFVRLVTQLVPEMRGMEFLQSPAGQDHDYELVYDPQLKSADLWVDKQKRLTGYRGYQQFQDDTGLTFSSHVYKSDVGSASFKGVRFEVMP